MCLNEYSLYLCFAVKFGPEAEILDPCIVYSNFWKGTVCRTKTELNVGNKAKLYRNNKVRQQRRALHQMYLFIETLRLAFTANG